MIEHNSKFNPFHSERKKEQKKTKKRRKTVEEKWISTFL